MNNPRLQNTIDIATWLVVAALVALLLVIAVGYVLSLFGITVTWIHQLFQLIAATAVGLLFGHQRATRNRKE